jgi:pyrimidine precursor biosynthesis enzyme
VQIQIDELTKYYGMQPTDYEAVRVGMNVSQAIINGTIDAGIGLENVQQCELEEWLKTQGVRPAPCLSARAADSRAQRPASDVKMLRIDELAELGCCCFCSILYIANEAFLATHPDKARAFMRAVKHASDLLLAEPAAAWAAYKAAKKAMDTPLNAKIFERSFTYMSRDCANVPRVRTSPRVQLSPRTRI